MSKFVTPARRLSAIAIFGTLLLVLPSQPAQGQTIKSADYELHIKKLNEKWPGFNITIEKPFVVISDESPEMLKRRCKSIRWAVDRLKSQYFEFDPEHIINIWLFKDKASYESNVEEMFGNKPGTPYGYYSSHHRALVMNISTGGGTLVHEIVHPFIERNFPNCPSWFNEGLASLYEQSGDRDGKIAGFTNWRLAGLQRAITARTVPAFQNLCETTTREFYDEDRGTNYAQARYLCYFLQQRGKLNKFYHSFAQNVDTDPTGYKTLVAILKEDDMKRFQKQWQDYVMKLSYP